MSVGVMVKLRAAFDLNVFVTSSDAMEKFCINVESSKSNHTKIDQMEGQIKTYVTDNVQHCLLKRIWKIDLVFLFFNGKPLSKCSCFTKT